VTVPSDPSTVTTPESKTISTWLVHRESALNADDQGFNFFGKSQVLLRQLAGANQALSITELEATMMKTSPTCGAV